MVLNRVTLADKLAKWCHIPASTQRRWSATAVTMGIVAAALGATPVQGLAEAVEPDTVFTIVQVPDTQQEPMTDNPLMANRYQWITTHRLTDDIQFVVHTGDVVNWGVVDPVQFMRADAATKVLDGSGIPYAYAIGNHDTPAVTVGGNPAPGNVRTNLRNTTKFNAVFPPARLRHVKASYEAGKVDNMVQTFRAGGMDWLVLTLEMWPRSGVITWAQGVLAAYPRHNVIINTHANIDAQGDRQLTGIYGDNSAQVLWDRLGARYPNVRMILSGHYGPNNGGLGASYNTVTGVNGNRVLQVMTAYTSLYQNHLRILTIDTKNMTVTSAVQVPLSLRSAYPSGRISDAASDFKVSGMGFLAPGKGVTAPGPPTAVVATPGNAAATVAFTPPADGGSPITGYTVTSSPGGVKATGARPPIMVNGLSNETAYTFTVTATNVIGTGLPSKPSSAVTPSLKSELLPDPSFEKGNGGWTPFNIGTMTRVATPVHSGAWAMKVQSPQAALDLVGMMHTSAAASSTAGKSYTARCYVRPSTANLEVRLVLEQYATDYASHLKLGATSVTNLPANTWTPVTITATATLSGQRIIPQIHASQQTLATGYLVYDDCSLS